MSWSRMRSNSGKSGKFTHYLQGLETNDLLKATCTLAGTLWCPPRILHRVVPAFIFSTHLPTRRVLAVTPHCAFMNWCQYAIACHALPKPNSVHQPFTCLAEPSVHASDHPSSLNTANSLTTESH